MRRRPCYGLLLISVGILLCVAPLQAQTPKKIPVIYDSDIGDDIDDTWALGFILQCPELDVKLVVGDNDKPVYRAKIDFDALDVSTRSSGERCKLCDELCELLAVSLDSREQ